MKNEDFENAANDIVSEKLSKDGLFAKIVFALKASYAAGVRDGKRNDAAPTNVVGIDRAKKP